MTASTLHPLVMAVLDCERPRSERHVPLRVRPGQVVHWRRPPGHSWTDEGVGKIADAAGDGTVRLVDSTLLLSDEIVARLARPSYFCGCCPHPGTNLVQSGIVTGTNRAVV